VAAAGAVLISLATSAFWIGFNGSNMILIF
jgi:hypothetical protein